MCVGFEVRVLDDGFDGDGAGFGVFVPVGDGIAELGRIEQGECGG